jgi:2-amino-4-hydroxy-6-hydroxymethyldihydropteridine diphosphokinase
MTASATEPVRAPVIACIALGANLGDARASLEAAMDAIGGLPASRLIARSSIWRTAPIGYADQPDFLNAVASIETTLDPHALLAALQAIEQSQGRERSFRNAPRTLDLDVLLYGDQHIDTPDLIVPHPRMHERAFVLAPLSEIAPDQPIAGHGRARDLLARLGGQRIERLVP